LLDGVDRIVLAGIETERGMDFPPQVGDDKVEVGELKSNLALNDILVVEDVVTEFDLEGQEGPSRIGAGS